MTNISEKGRCVWELQSDNIHGPVARLSQYMHDFISTMSPLHLALDRHIICTILAHRQSSLSLLWAVLYHNLYSKCWPGLRRLKAQQFVSHLSITWNHSVSFLLVLIGNLNIRRCSLSWRVSIFCPWEDTKQLKKPQELLNALDCQICRILFQYFASLALLSSKWCQRCVLIMKPNAVLSNYLVHTVTEPPCWLTANFIFLCWYVGFIKISLHWAREQ